MSTATLNEIYAIAQIATAILLIVFVLLQRQSSSLSGAFGGEGTQFHTKRGAEKSLFLATIFTAIVFMAVTLSRDMLR